MDSDRSPSPSPPSLAPVKRTIDIQRRSDGHEKDKVVIRYDDDVDDDAEQDNEDEEAITIKPPQAFESASDSGRHHKHKKHKKNKDKKSDKDRSRDRMERFSKSHSIEHQASGSRIVDLKHVKSDSASEYDKRVQVGWSDWRKGVDRPGRHHHQYQQQHHGRYNYDAGGGGSYPGQGGGGYDYDRRGGGDRYGYRDRGGGRSGYFQYNANRSQQMPVRKRSNSPQNSRERDHSEKRRKGWLPSLDTMAATSSPQTMLSSSATSVKPTDSSSLSSSQPQNVKNEEELREQISLRLKAQTQQEPDSPERKEHRRREKKQRKRKHHSREKSGSRKPKTAHRTAHSSEDEGTSARAGDGTPTRDEPRSNSLAKKHTDISPATSDEGALPDDSGDEQQAASERHLVGSKRSSKEEDSDGELSDTASGSGGSQGTRSDQSEDSVSDTEGRPISGDPDEEKARGSKYSKFVSSSEDEAMSDQDSDVDSVERDDRSESTEPIPEETPAPTEPTREESMSPVDEFAHLPAYYPAVSGCRTVDEFECLNKIEEGTYGVVYRAEDKRTGEIVALKRLKMEKEKEGFPITSLREVNTLLKAQHDNIVNVREIVVGSNMDKIYIVMGYVEHDMKSLMESMKQPFLIGEVKTLISQLLAGVHHLHDNWILHRDLKTSNLLLSHQGILKIGDFGLAREYGSPLKPYTPVVVTLWYRAPELLLGTKEYSTPIDLWSVGCIMAEFLTLKPLFPGRGEQDAINRIFKELGTPNERIWPGYSELPLVKQLKFPNYPYNNIRRILNHTLGLTENGFELANKLLTYDPKRRITAKQALEHSWFQEKPNPIPPHLFPTWPAKSEKSKMPRKVQHEIQSPRAPSGGKQFHNKQEENEENNIYKSLNVRPHEAAGGFSLKFDSKLARL